MFVASQAKSRAMRLRTSSAPTIQAKRIADPLEIANAGSYLASDDSAYVVGQTS